MTETSNMNDEDKIWHVAIVGGGAAGLMAAITARRAGLEVLLLEGKEKIGAKILMSGGTRCNVTNERVTERDFESENKRVLRDILRSFPAEKAVRFFEDLGVDFVLEPGGKFFPSTHSAKTVLDALLKEVHKTGVCVETKRKITKVKFEEGRFTLSGENFSCASRSVVLSTGGLSYPTTGSDGAGYEIARSFGHRLVFTTPALTPLQTDDPDWKTLAGVSLPVCLTLWVDGKKNVAFEDSFLFTHFGFSGPAALNISRYWIRAGESRTAKMTANFLPGEKEESLRADLIRASEKHPSRFLGSFLCEKLPERFVETVFKKIGVDPDVILNQLNRAGREKLIRSLFYFPLNVTGVMGYPKAEVTAGGVDLKEVNPKTLESSLQPGLFFAGEMLDVDGRIGGFNFQWAWSSGFAAGSGVAKKIKSLKSEVRS